MQPLNERIIKNIIKSNADEAVVSLLLNGDLGYFKGHFPGLPLLPGVGQLDLAIHLAGKIFSFDKQQVESVSYLKFIKLIKPNEDINLHMTISLSSLIFHYEKNNSIYAKGKVNLKREII